MKHSNMKFRSRGMKTWMKKNEARSNNFIEMCKNFLIDDANFLGIQLDCVNGDQFIYNIFFEDLSIWSTNIKLVSIVGE